MAKLRDTNFQFINAFFSTATNHLQQHPSTEARAKCETGEISAQQHFGANKLFSDKAGGLEDDQGGLDGPLHQQGHYEEETLLAPRLQVHHHVQGKTANI